MAQRIPDFDIVQEGYGSAVVTVYKANTTTLASIFSDEAGTAPLANPQTLNEVTVGDISGGKWAQPVYVDEPYYLSINNSEQTGIERPGILTLDGEDASKATVQVAGGVVDRELEDHLAQIIWAADYGVFDSDAANNTAIITAALGAANSAGGGRVMLPAGTIVFNSVTVATKVRLCGKGRGVTTLQSTFAGDVITVSGAGGGLEDLTLDGVSNQVGSRGVRSTNVSDVILNNVEIKRFNRNLYIYGGAHMRFRELFVTDATDQNAYFHGNAASSGAMVQFIEWIGGECSRSTARSMHFDYDALENSFIRLSGLKIDGNATSILFDGSRFVAVDNCHFVNNTGNIHTRNANGIVQSDPNYRTQSVKFFNCLFDQGTMTHSGDVSDVVYESCQFKGVAFTLTTPLNAIVLKDCIEDSSVTISGDGTKLIRFNTNLDGATKGVTTGNTPTKAWSLKLEQGEMCAGIALVTGKQRNGINTAIYNISFAAKRANSTLAYDAQTANFTVGAKLTGATSGATARIVADADGGVTGTLTLHSINGDFIDNEIITDDVTGSATANGILAPGAVTILDQDVISTAETDASWACAIAGTAEECEVQVTGAAAQTIDWTVQVRAMREN